MAINKRKKSRIIIPQSKTSQDYLDEGRLGKGIKPRGDEIAIATPPESTQIAYRSKHINSSVMGSLSMAIKKLKLSKEDVLGAMELFINQRTKTPEFIRIGQMLEFYQKNLNQVEKKAITYEDLAEKFAIDHTLFIAAIAGGMYSVNLNLAKTIFAEGMVDMAGAIVHRASQKKSGTLDAKLALQVTGLLDESTKVNVGSVVNGNVNGGAVGGSVGDNNTLAPVVKQDIMSIDDMLRESYVQARRGDVDAIEIEAEEI